MEDFLKGLFETVLWRSTVEGVRCMWSTLGGPHEGGPLEGVSGGSSMERVPLCGPM